MAEAASHVFKAVLSVASRSMVVYGALFLLAGAMIDFEKIRLGSEFKDRHAQFSPRLKSLLNPKDANQRLYQDCVDYYERLVAYIPNGQYARDILGYCYFQDGNFEKAADSYQKAAGLLPDIFWHSYNLGLVYLRMGDFVKAQEALARAARTDARRTIDYFLTQKAVYGPFLDQQNNADFLKKRLLAGYHNCYELLVLMNYNSGDFIKMLFFAKKAQSVGLDDKGLFSLYAGIAAFRLESFDQAVLFFQTTISRGVLAPQAYHYLGKIFEKFGRGKEAADAFKRSEKFNEGDLKLYLNSYHARPEIF